MNEGDIISSLSRIEAYQSNIINRIDEMKEEMRDLSSRISILENKQAECKGRQKFQTALVAVFSAVVSAGATGAVMKIMGV